MLRNKKHKPLMKGIAKNMVGKYSHPRPQQRPNKTFQF